MSTIMIANYLSPSGLATAKYFREREWTVIANMRTPNDNLLPQAERLRILSLDVTDPRSIRHVVNESGPIDVLVNNASAGVLNALEGTSMETVRNVFETNIFGTMAMIQVVLLQFRQRMAGIVINVISTVTLKSFRLLSL